MNVARLAIEWKQGDHVAPVCVIHVRSVDSHDPFDEGMLGVVMNAAATWWRDGTADFQAGRDAYTTHLRLHRITAQRVEPDESAIYALDGEDIAGTLFSVGPTGIPFVGGTYIVPEPPQLCWLVGLRTLVESRSTRGRMYLPATFQAVAGDNPGPFHYYDEGFRADGKLDANHVQYAATVACGLIASFRDIGGYGEAEFVSAVYSRTHREVHTVTHLTVSDHLKTQRHRQKSISYVPYGLDGTPAL